MLSRRLSDTGTHAEQPKNVLAASREKKAEEHGSSEQKKKPKKLREVYLVSKKKFYSTATSDELDQELQADCLSDTVHRIIQAKVR